MACLFQRAYTLQKCLRKINIYIINIINYNTRLSRLSDESSMFVVSIMLVISVVIFTAVSYTHLDVYKRQQLTLKFKFIILN